MNNQASRNENYLTQSRKARKEKSLEIFSFENIALRGDFVVAKFKRNFAKIPKLDDWNN